MEAITLKCGCKVTPEGEFVLGEHCEKVNCGECRTVSRLHPFGRDRFADLLFNL